MNTCACSRVEYTAYYELELLVPGTTLLAEMCEMSANSCCPWTPGSSSLHARLITPGYNSHIGCSTLSRDNICLFIFNLITAFNIVTDPESIIYTFF